MISPLGKKQPRDLVIGLRSVVKDRRATVTQRFEACKLLAALEGYSIEGCPRERAREEAETANEPQNISTHATASTETTSRLRRLLETSEQAA
jgi:hypothetical protein